MTYSFASAFFHLGTQQVGSEVFSKSKKIIERHNTLTTFIETLKHNSHPLYFQYLNHKRWNILENEENNLVIALLRGSNTKEDHCVTLYGKWIFDSNFSNALPLTKESLDLCCSSDDSKEFFVKVVQALLCTNYTKYMNLKNQNKRKRKN